MWKFQVIWGTRKKNFLPTTFMTSLFRHQRKIAWLWLPSHQRSLQHWLIFFFQRYYPIYREHVQKKFECIWYLVWVLYSFKKVIFPCPYEHRWNNGLRVYYSLMGKVFTWQYLENFLDKERWSRFGIIQVL